MANHDGDAADLLVISGIIGDLARKMTFRAPYWLEQQRSLQFPIIEVAARPLETNELVKRAREAIADSGEQLDDAVFDRFAGRLTYVSGDVTDSALGPPADGSASDTQAGKALPRRVTEIRMLLRRTPELAFLPEPGKTDPNQIVLRIDPNPGARLQLAALAQDTWRTFHLDTSFTRELGVPLEPYEQLLNAAIVGDHHRQDSVEETWRIVQPVLTDPPEVRPYQRGSWGPAEAASLVRGHPRWQQPWLSADS
jgi:glucose-6-phosphate 1-dehydrogenase